MNSQVAADLVRIFFVIVPASIIGGVTVFVMITYYRSYNRDKFKQVRKGLLPLHVWTIALSYLLFIVDAVISSSERAGSPLTIHVFTTAPASLLGVVSLSMVLRHLKNRRTLEAPIMDEITDEDLRALRDEK